MKAILSSRRHRYVTRVSIFLVMVALIAGMVGCGGGGGGGGPYTLTMAVAPGGSGNATDLTGASPYAANTSVNIQAVADQGYSFVNWTAPAGTFGNQTAATTTFTMPAQNVIVTANFGLEIYDWYDLDAVRNNLTGSYILMNNLNSTSPGYVDLASPTANGGKGWQPIGNVTHLFAGSLNGQGYEVCNLFIDRSDESYVGFFGYIAVDGRIEDIGVVNANVTGGNFVGGLVGGNAGTVSDSYSTGSVTGGNSSYWVGGLVGRNSGPVSNSYATGNVTGDSYVGGLAGYNDGGPVSNSYATGNVTGNGNVGGLVGYNGGPVSNSYATGNVTGYNYVGGLVGYNGYSTVNGSYSTGSVTGNGNVGGLVGYNGGPVSNSYATGNVTGNSDVGGLVGFNCGPVSDCYSIGSVTGGGLVGSGCLIHGPVSNSFWDTETSGQTTSAGGTGKNTTEMKDIMTFSGATWNITTVGGIGERNTTYIWNIVHTATYPFLSWQP